jgi:GntR family transcriptional regulator / MocR family aminotransferase
MRIPTGPQILAHLPITKGGPAPLHNQIYEGLRGAILAGSIRPGQRVPSTRELAVELGVSRLPVLYAYEQLRHEGYLEGRKGSGTFVSEALPELMLNSGPPSGARRKRVDARVASSPASAARHEGGLRPFRVTLPALDHFPHEVWSQIVARRARGLTPAMMAYGNPAGLLPLRAAIAEYLRTYRAVRCEHEHVIVSAGSQAALRICAGVVFKRGDVVAIEEPGYPGAAAAFRADGAELVPIPVDAEGLNVDALSAIRRRVRAVYITPSHQYPLGSSMSAARRIALLEWAERKGAWIIEDDYDSEYRYVSRPLGALHGMSSSGRVVYIGTFSRVLFPALRIGYLIAPPSLVNAFVKSSETLAMFSATLYQTALTDFLREGYFARHLRRMRVLYRARRDALLDGLQRNCADVLTVHNADAGLHVATLLARGIDDTRALREIAEFGLAANSLSSCYIGLKPRQGLLLGFGGSDEGQLSTATRDLGKILRSIAGTL